MNISDQQISDWFGYMIVSGVAFILLLWLFTGTERGRQIVANLLAHIGEPSASECKRMSGEMLNDMDANTAAKKAATIQPH